MLGSAVRCNGRPGTFAFAGDKGCHHSGRAPEAGQRFAAGPEIEQPVACAITLFKFLPNVMGIRNFSEKGMPPARIIVLDADALNLLQRLIKLLLHPAAGLG